MDGAQELRMGSTLYVRMATNAADRDFSSAIPVHYRMGGAGMSASESLKICVNYAGNFIVSA